MDIIGNILGFFQSFIDGTVFGFEPDNTLEYVYQIGLIILSLIATFTNFGGIFGSES